MFRARRLSKLDQKRFVVAGAGDRKHGSDVPGETPQVLEQRSPSRPELICKAPELRVGGLEGGPVLGRKHLRHDARQTLIRTDHFGQAGCSAVHWAPSQNPVRGEDSGEVVDRRSENHRYNDLSLIPAASVVMLPHPAR